MRLKALKVLAFLTFLSFAFSLNNASAEEESDFEKLHKEFPNAVHVLTEDEGKEEENKKLAEKVFEDMKKNPGKVQYATPIDDADKDDTISTNAVVLPYAYDFEFTAFLRGENFVSYTGYSRLYNQMTLDTSNSLVFSVYNEFGTFVGSIIYPGDTTSESYMTIQPGAEYYFVLTGFPEDSSGTRRGSGYLRTGLL